MKKSFAMMLAVCLVIVAVGSLAPSQPKPAPLDPQKLAAETEALIKKIPEARYVLEARAKELGAGIEPVFALVRDEIRFESYPGVFRGASGSFLARAGNAADRSLLLARLLELKGVPSRFAVGRLSTEDAERLFAHIFDPPRVAVGLAVPDAGATDAQTAGLEERLFARAKHDFGIIRSALGRDLAPLTSPSRDDILAELEAHVWVQANMSGRCINLDTAFPDAVPGKAYASAVENPYMWIIDEKTLTSRRVLIRSDLIPRVPQRKAGTEYSLTLEISWAVRKSVLVLGLASVFITGISYLLLK